MMAKHLDCLAGVALLLANRVLATGMATGIAIGLVAGLTVATPQPALGQGAPSSAIVVDIDGFRGASFGMNEEDVRRAVVADYGVADSDIARVLNPLEGTVSLAVTVNDLIPDAGQARLVYLFGHASGTLTQVSIQWGATVASDTPVETLLASDQMLRRYFSQRQFVPGSLLNDLPLSDGSYLSFTGSDEEGHRATLTIAALGVDFLAIDPANPPTDRPLIVRLTYTETPGEADVFRISPPG